MQRLIPLAVTLMVGVMLLACAPEAPGKESDPVVRLDYVVALDPESGSARITLSLTKPERLLKELDFNAAANRFTGFRGDGKLEVEADRVRWKPPAKGGTIRYRTQVDSLRGKVYEAKLTPEWALFRLDDLVPPAVTRARAGTRSEATLQLSDPEDWSFETPYGRGREEVHRVTSDRLFVRPTGWAIAGKIGIRRDTIGGREVAIAAPMGEGARRQDMLAFLRWTLPTVIEVFPQFPQKILLVSGSPDMWRGGLSGPSSLYLHVDRPLISGNGTSALIHELIHVAVASLKSESDDWLVEGLAEYYSLEVLRRTDGISQERFDSGLEKLEAWAKRKGGRLKNPSTGPHTAYATLRLHELATQLEDHGFTLDSVVAELMASGPVSGKRLAQLLEERGIAGDTFAAASSR